MYKGKDKKTLSLFKELFPFGGQLDQDNRWLRIARLIPWDRIEDNYRRHFAAVGRPALEARLWERLTVISQLYQQQWRMYKAKTVRIAERLVSLSRPWVRPMVRGKAGKRVEFGPKGAISYVDGFMFLDYLDHEGFAEAGLVEQQITNYRRRFLKDPAYMIGDRSYGNRDNRALLELKGIKDAFEPLGRKIRQKTKRDRWRKQKQKERNRIEGSLGHAKEHFNLEKIKYYAKGGAEIWIRLGILGLNLKTAAARA